MVHRCRPHQGIIFFNWQGVRGGGVIITATSERFPSGDYFFNWHEPRKDEYHDGIYRVGSHQGIIFLTGFSVNSIQWLPSIVPVGSHQGIIFLTGPVFETADIY